MPKLIQNNYYTSKGEKKINGYHVAITKQIVKDAGFTGEEEIKVYAKDKKIIVEKMEE